MMRACLPRGRGGIPYINEHDQATIAIWFEQNLPPLLHEWDQPIQPEPGDDVPPYWVPMAKELPQF